LRYSAFPSLGGTKKKKSSIVYRQFMGSMRIHTRKILPTDIDAAKRAELMRSGEYEWRVSWDKSTTIYWWNILGRASV
jgi:hypothetical protein